MALKRGFSVLKLADRTGLEPATSGVTGRHSNQLNYDPADKELSIEAVTDRVSAGSASGFELAPHGGRCGTRTRDPLRVRQVL